MKTSKLLWAALAGGVVYFLLGWLVYGMLLMDFFEKNSGGATGVMREQMVWWSLILGNLLVGCLLAWVFGRWAGIKTFMGGLVGGLVLGFLVSAAYDFTGFGVMNLNNLQGAIVDIVVNTLMMGITGGVVGWVLGMGKE